jgi:hypothetical protein
MRGQQAVVVLADLIPQASQTSLQPFQLSQAKLHDRQRVTRNASSRIASLF